MKKIYFSILSKFGFIFRINCGPRSVAEYLAFLHNIKVFEVIFEVQIIAMDAFLGKKYKLESSEKFDEFMEALGVGFWTRQGAKLVSPTVELTKEGDEYSLSTQSTFKSQIIKFKPGVTFDEVTLDGRDVKSTITFEGNKIIHESRGEKNSKIIREYTPEKMTAILSVDDVVSTRVYKLVE